MKSPIFTFVLLMCAFGLLAQGVGVGTETPDASAVLDIRSADKGVLVPRMSTPSRMAIAMPADGLMVFDTSTHSFWYFRDTAWVDLSALPAVLSDADGDTRVQVEKNPDEDIIRFELGGAEKILFQINSQQIARMAFVNQSGNVCIGDSAGAQIMAGINNTAVGDRALHQNTSGGSNVAIGRYAMRANVGGSNNTALGVQSLELNTSGGSNTGIGRSALLANTTGAQNTALGVDALRFNTTGNQNVAVGVGAILWGQGNSRSTAVGTLAMQDADNRAQGRETFNTALGSAALRGSS